MAAVASPAGMDFNLARESNAPRPKLIEITKFATFILVSLTYFPLVPSFYDYDLFMIIATVIAIVDFLSHSNRFKEL